jgi:ribosomal protein L40E
MMPEELLGERSMTEELDDEFGEPPGLEADRIPKASNAKRQYIVEEKGVPGGELGTRSKREEKLEEKSSTPRLMPNPEAVPQLAAAVKCRACGANNSPSALACLTCFSATNESSWKEEIEEVLSELLGAMLIIRNWGDRGARTAKSDQRRRYKRYRKRALQLGCNAVAERFFDDYMFRSNMLDGGWHFND